LVTAYQNLLVLRMLEAYKQVKAERPTKSTLYVELPDAHGGLGHP